jgi:hypothetical protein
MIRKIHNFLSAQLGLDFVRLGRAFLALPGYFRDLRQFRKESTQRIVLRPCLHDSQEEGGTAKGEYFWQDLYVARKIYQAAPQRHVDVASKFDGFVAHVASFREIEVIDIRPIRAVIPGVLFRQMDLMSTDVHMDDYCDSLSCLHALEHFGLGRYGDPLDPDGHVKGLRNLVRLLKLNGRLYLSTPIGVERIEFNANRVFCPERLVDLAEQMGLRLDRLGWVTQDSPVIESVDFKAELSKLKQMHYALGIFIFTKTAKP